MAHEGSAHEPDGAVVGAGGEGACRSLCGIESASQIEILELLAEGQNLSQKGLWSITPLWAF